MFRISSNFQSGNEFSLYLEIRFIVIKTILPFLNSNKIITTRKCCNGAVSIQNGDSFIRVPNDYISFQRSDDSNKSIESKNINQTLNDFCSITIPGTKFISLPKTKQSRSPYSELYNGP